MKKRLLYFGVIFTFVLGSVTVPGENVQAAGTIALTTMGTAYTQDFDTLANTGTANSMSVLNGWYLIESGNGVRDNDLYGADDGGGSTGDTYSYGPDSSSERALGGLRSSSLIPIYGASFTNNTGSDITTLEIAYTGEEWRLGSAGRTDQLVFAYSLDATSLTDGTWIGIPALDFITPDTVTSGPKDGNAANERTALSATISDLNIPNGTTFWIRWTDPDASGSDDGLAIDDFSLVPVGAAITMDTTVSLTTAPNPSLLGEWVTMTATVSAIPPEAGTPTGFVQFFDSGEPSGDPAELEADGTAVSMTQLLSVGDHHLTVAYLGNDNFNPSTSSEVVQTVDIDPTTISFTRQTPAISPTNFDSLIFRVTFSKGVIGVDTADFAVNGTTTATVMNVSLVSSSVYDVAISGGDLSDFSGTVGLNFSSLMSITDLNDHALANSEPLTDEEYTVDNTAPDTQVDSHPADPSSDRDAVFIFSSEDPLATFECQLDSSGFSTCTSPREYTGLLDGTHTFEVRARDAADNVDPSPASYIWTVDTLDPIVVSITRLNGSPSNRSTVFFLLTFSEAVIGVNAADFTFTTTGGISGASIAGVSGSGTTRAVAVNTGTGDGTIRLDVLDDDTIQDASGNPLGGSFAAGQEYTIDKTAPTVISVTRLNGNPSSRTTVFYLVTFSESVTGANLADFTLTTAGDLAGASIVSISGSGATRMVGVNTGTGDGTLRLDILDDGTIKDATANPLGGSFAAGQQYTLDKTAPTVVSSLRLNNSPTNRSTVFCLVTFSESVVGVNAADFTLTTIGDMAGASIASVTGSGATRTVSVNTGSGNGTLRLDVLDDDTIKDVVANSLDGGFTAGQEYTIVR